MNGDDINTVYIKPEPMNNRLQINTLKITLWSFQWANDNYDIQYTQ